MKAYFRIIVSYIKEDLRAYVLFFILATVIGVMEFIGISSLLPAVSILLGEGLQSLPSFLSDLMRNIDPKLVIVVYVVLVFLQMAVSLVNENLFLKAMVRWGVQLSTEFVRNIIASDFVHGRKIKPGEIETVLVRNIGFSIRNRNRVAMCIGDSILSLVYILISVIISYHTFILFVIFGAMALLINYVTLKVRVKHSEIAKRKQFLVAQNISEHFSDLRGLLIAKTNIFLKRVEQLTYDAFKSLTRNSQITMVIRNLHQPVILAIILLAVFIWKSALGMSNSTILIALYVFYRAAPRLISAVTEFSGVIEESPSDVKPEIAAWRQFIPRKRVLSLPCDASIRFDHVDLGYKEKELLLHNIQFTVRPGELVCIIGKSGTGKSSILDVICGFKSPDKGEVRLGGVKYHEIDWVAWRSKLGLLRAEGVVVSGSWVENVAFLTDNPDFQKVKEVLQAVGLMELVEESVEEIQSLITARGANLSAGQRQRLLLARALYRNPDLLILDEPTSNLDAKTEEDICALLARLKGTMTILVVSHSDIVQQQADHIYQLTSEGSLTPIKV